jgi:outer membrane lipoprotein SlyB
MNRQQQSMLLAGLLSLGLAACSSTRMAEPELSTAARDNIPVTSGTVASSAIGSSAMDSTAAGTAAVSAMPSPAPAPIAVIAPAPVVTNSVVTAVELVPRHHLDTVTDTGAVTHRGAAIHKGAAVHRGATVHRGAAGARGAVGGSGATGATASAAGRDGVYRITVLMDDGSIGVITQEHAPILRSGDRVRMSIEPIAQ